MFHDTTMCKERAEDEKKKEITSTAGYSYWSEKRSENSWSYNNKILSAIFTDWRNYKRRDSIHIDRRKLLLAIRLLVRMLHQLCTMEKLTVLFLQFVWNMKTKIRDKKLKRLER